MPSKQTSTLRKDEFATPKAPNKSVAGMRNIVQADIKVSFMAPQDSYESQATYAVCSNLYPSGRDADATDTWLAPPGDSQGTPIKGVRKRRATLLRPFHPFLRPGLNGIRKSLGR
jgi:hypothetical protein